jgi:hypothetical protein
MYDFTCNNPIHTDRERFCIFHDKSYLKGDSYEKHKEEVADKFKDKLSKYRSNNMPLKFIGYCLPEISFDNDEFTLPLYFNDAAFYGATTFSKVKFSELVF